MTDNPCCTAMSLTDGKNWHIPVSLYTQRFSYSVFNHTYYPYHYYKAVISHSCFGALRVASTLTRVMTEAMLDRVPCHVFFFGACLMKRLKRYVLSFSFHPVADTDFNVYNHNSHIVDTDVFILYVQAQLLYCYDWLVLKVNNRRCFPMFKRSARQAIQTRRLH